LTPPRRTGYRPPTARETHVPHRLRRRAVAASRAALLAALFAAPFAAPVSTAAHAAATAAEIARGKYLVSIGGCTDCHTPGHFLGHPDLRRYLGGSDVGFAIPGRGVFVGPNLTPDKATGLGDWTRQQIVTALTTGARPDGRILAPAMPWRAFSHLTRADAFAIAAYLRTIPPVVHKVPGPFGPGATPDVFVMTVLPGPAYAAMQAHAAHKSP
jgi:mono/diheme cytochrome c family protein